MPIPLVWLGAGIAAIYAGDKVHHANKLKRQYVTHYPGEDRTSVTPENGAIVCCGIFGVFEHTGIWVDGNIIELRGNGLIRGISPERFLKGRSGNQIYVLCDGSATPLIAPNIEASAIARLYEFIHYDLIKNNCHRFVWQCIAHQNETVTSFADLNRVLYHYFQTPLSWCTTDFNAV